MKNFSYLCFLCFIIVACSTKNPNEATTDNETPINAELKVILDTDANNEIDDQHAIAYMLFNGDIFDVVALAILKNAEFGETREIPAPKLINNEWFEQPDNPRKIVIWENFDEEGILADFFSSMNSYTIAD